jgi:hypothetical protein
MFGQISSSNSGSNHGVSSVEQLETVADPIRLDMSAVRPPSSTMIECDETRACLSNEGSFDLDNFVFNPLEFFDSDSEELDEQSTNTTESLINTLKARKGSANSISRIVSYGTEAYDQQLTYLVKHNCSPLSNHRSLRSCYSVSTSSGCSVTSNVDLLTSSDCVSTIGGFPAFSFMHSTKISTPFNAADSTSCETCKSDTIKCNCSNPDSLNDTSHNNSSSPVSSTLISASSSQSPEAMMLSTCSDRSRLALMISNLSLNLTQHESTKAQEPLHVCTDSYDATFVEDVSVQFAETVRILRDTNDEWLYVQVANDGREGYVPRAIVLDLKKFIGQLKSHYAHALNSIEND